MLKDLSKPNPTVEAIIETLESARYQSEQKFGCTYVEMWEAMKSAARQSERSL